MSCEECGVKLIILAVMTKGEGLSGYYRYLTRHGNFIWMQSHATMIHDNRTGDPSYIVCVNFIIK